MTVRVTQSMLNRTFLQNLSRNLASLDKLQNQLSSGRKIAKPSDDPVVAVRGMTYRSALVEIEQFKRNVDEGLTWLETTDKALDEATNLLQRARELLVHGLNGAMTTEDRAAMAKEIAQIKEQLGNVANTAVAGRYIFAGTDTKNPPYDAQTGRGSTRTARTFSWRSARASICRSTCWGRTYLPCPTRQTASSASLTPSPAAWAATRQWTSTCSSASWMTS